MNSQLTQRRLRDGALAMSVPMPATLDGLRAYKETLHDGIAALQSLDDLGSEEANDAAWADMTELQRRYRVVVEKIAKLETER